MPRKRTVRGPQFVRFMPPVLEALKELGGSARPSEVEALVYSMVGISEEEQEERTGSGQLRMRNQVHWARFYLTRAGLIDSSKRGVWTLTAEGRNTSLSHEEALEVFRVTHRELPDEDDPEVSSGDEDATEDEEEPAVAHRSALMQKLLSMPPDAFERLCQRLLRESGFERVHVTGRSGDGGLDGNGVLQVNPFVSFQVLFQCKRYQGSVGAPVVRDFRGAMMGRADKGIILTTGTFTAEAHREAVRDGVPPIELVDGDKLMGLMESLELGVSPVTAYEIDEHFFIQLTGS